MFDQQRRLSEPLRWGRREKRVVAVLVAVVVLAGGGLVAYGLTSGSGTARADCIHLTFASTLGAARFDACGARARHACASPGQLPGLQHDLRAACRRAGFKYGGG